MKKIAIFLFLVLTFSFVSCSTMYNPSSEGAMFEVVEKEGTNDINGQKMTYLMLVDEVSFGSFADTVFRAYIAKDTLDGKLTRYYWHLYGGTSRLDEFKLKAVPKMRIDDGEVITLFSDWAKEGGSPEYSKRAMTSVIISEQDFEIPSTEVEKLKSAKKLVLQYYYANGGDVPVELSEEAIAKIAEFVSN